MDWGHSPARNVLQVNIPQMQVLHSVCPARQIRIRQLKAPNTVAAAPQVDTPSPDPRVAVSPRLLNSKFMSSMTPTLKLTQLQLSS